MSGAVARATNVLLYHGPRRAIRHPAEIELQILQGTEWRRCASLALFTGVPSSAAMDLIRRWVYGADES